MGVAVATMEQPFQVPLWGEDYVLGHEAVDRDHSIVFTLLGLLENEVILGRKDEAIRRNILTFMIEFIRRHFDWEERHMLHLGYPDVAEHREMHERFKIWMGQILDRFGFHPDHDIALLESLSQWWISHILGEDRRHVDFLSPSSEVQAMVR